MDSQRNLNEHHSFKQLEKQDKVDLRQSMSYDRIHSYRIHVTEAMDYYFSSAPVDENILSLLQSLAQEAQLIEQYKALRCGEIKNMGENRFVLHHLLRSVELDAHADVLAEYYHFFQEQKKSIEEYVEDIWSEKIKNIDGEPFESLVHVGIGGSYLGPKVVIDSLRQWASQDNIKVKKAHFIANVDPDALCSVLDQVNAKRTLFIVVSKSGTTEEILANENLIRQYLSDFYPRFDFNSHFIYIHSRQAKYPPHSPMSRQFFLDDSIGGRFSVSSVVGLLTLGLSYGNAAIHQFLSGLYAMDKMAQNRNIYHNPPLLDALIGIYERNILGYSSLAILSYSYALGDFYLHLQQLEMESNGKTINRDGIPLNYPTCPVIWGGEGTNIQHSFAQHLHQGSEIIPTRFILYSQAQTKTKKEKLEHLIELSQKKLVANGVAQIMALSQGHQDENLNKNFVGNRPSTTLHVHKSLDPYNLGLLFSHYENKVMFQGFLWNINSFDQEGVQLGKRLTQKVLSDDVSDQCLLAYRNLMNLKR